MVDKDQEEARDVIATLVSQTGLSVTEIARRAGIAPSTLTRLYPVPSVKYTLSARTLSKLRQLQQPAPAPANDAGAVREERQVFHASARPTLPLFRLAAAYPRPESALADFRLEILQGDLDVPVARLPWPLAYGDDGRYFVTYMPDDSMVPRFRSGHYLLVDRVKPPSAGSEVLVVLAEGAAGPGTSYCIAQLLDRNRSQIKLRQHAEDATDVLARRDVVQIYAIVGSFDETLRR